MYNPYGNQRQNQGRYGASQNPAHDPEMGTSKMGYPFNSHGASASANPQSSLQTSHFNAPLSQPSSQMTPQRTDFYSSFASSYSAPSSAAQPPPSRASDTNSGIDGSLSWLRDISQSTSSKPRPSSSSSSSLLGFGDSQLERSKTAYQTYPHMNNPPPPTTPNYPSPAEHSTGTAATILKKFNLEKEDLEQLMAYSENELTPDNLPRILRQIQLAKMQKTSAASTSSTYKPPLPERPGFNSGSWTDSNYGCAGTTSGSVITGASQGVVKNSTGLTKESAPHTATATTSVPTERTSRWGPEITPSPSYPTAYPLQCTQLTKKQARKLKYGLKSTMPRLQVENQSKLGRLPKVSHTQFVPIYVPVPTPVTEDQKETQSVEDSKNVPPQALMLDYIAATPKSFPHTCTMCDKECGNMKEWIRHQNDPVHIQSCKQFTEKYVPDWNNILRPSAGNVTGSKSRSPSPEKTRRRSRSRSRSRSQSPVRRRRRNDDRRTSPRRSQDGRYSPSRYSPSRDLPSRYSPSRFSPSRYSPSRYSPSRYYPSRVFPSRYSPQRCTPPRRAEDRHSPPCRYYDRRTSPQWSQERDYSTKRHSPSRYFPSRYSPQRRTPPRHSPSRYSPSRLTPPRGRDRRQRGEREDQRSLSRTSRDRRSLSDTRSASSEGDKLKQATRKIPETSSGKKAQLLKSLSKIDNVDDFLETAAMSPTMVTLCGIADPLTQHDVMAFAEKFGKIKSVSVFSVIHEAKVHFEKEEDARKLRNATDLRIKGLRVRVAKPRYQEEDSAVMKSKEKSTKSSKSETAPAQDSDSKVTEPAPSKSTVKSDTVTEEPMEEMTKSELKPESTKNVSSLSKEPEVSFQSIGENLDQVLTVNFIKSLVIKQTQVFDPDFLEGDRTQLLLTDLPEYDPERPYTEDDLVKRLKPFRFQHEPDNLYILPQCRMAFVTMPDSQAVQNLVRNFTSKPESYATFGDSTMTAHVLADNGYSFVTPYCFYVSLMNICKFQRLRYRQRSDQEGETAIFITNISDSDAAELKKRLQRIGSVINYMPMLNKVFVEFDLSRDADRLGVYHSLLSTAPSYEINRITVPLANEPTWSPVSPANALPDETERVPGVVVLEENGEIPLGCGSQFWVTLNSKPFLFPTRSPWFIIPDFTALTLESLDKSQNRTVMLTGLPVNNYTLRQVLELTLSTGSSHCRHYNIIVLPLQRRAFIYFPTAEACADFCKKSLTKKPTINNDVLRVHYVNSKLLPVSCEEEVYSTFMKLSNNRVPAAFLEQRLLCVSVKEFSLDLIRLVMEVVTSAAPILGFLPLANRICIEVPKVSDVANVRKKFSRYKPESDSELQCLWYVL